MAAAAMVISAGAVLALFAEEPAEASERRDALPTFEQSFEQFEMDKQETVPSPATVVAAETRFHNAPAEEADQIVGTGTASYYGAELAGQRTASGEPFDPTELTAAHRSLPFGTMVKVTNQRNGRSVVVRINDRGPFHGNRLIDLSREAAKRIGLVATGQGRVELALYSS